MDFEKYERRLRRSGENTGEVLSENTLTFIDINFHNSPTFRVLGVNGIEFPDIMSIDARVIEIERMGTLREILFRPSHGLNMGTYVTFDGDIWLTYDKWGSIESGNLKTLVQKCNRVLSWMDYDGIKHDLDCIASATPLGSKSHQGKSDVEWNKFDVRLPIGQLFIFVEARENTKAIEMSQRFIIGSKVYEVVGIDETTLIDKNNFGVIQLTVKVTTVRVGDDFETNVAVNEYDRIQNNQNQIQSRRIVDDNDDEGGSIW